MTRFFVVGPPHTGTTLLARLLSQHPDIACLAQSAVLAPASRESLVHPDGRRWADHGFTGEHAARWSTVAATEPPAAALRAILEDAWSHLAGAGGALAAGDAWTGYAHHLPVLFEAFPEARYVYVVRDPRAVYWSADTLRDRREGPAATADQLAADRRLRPFLAKEVTPGHAVVVSHETLVRAPRSVLDRLWAFLGVDPAKGVVEREGWRDPLPRRWASFANVVAPLDPSRSHRWQREMPLTARRVVGLAGAEYCATYGYDVEIEEPYLVDEMLAAFLCGGLIEHYPFDVEERVRGELSAALRPVLAEALAPRPESLPSMMPASTDVPRAAAG